MKVEKQKEAIHLRKEGWSIKKITASLGVSSSSVSRWVKDVILTREQIESLYCSKMLGSMLGGQKTGQSHSERCLKKRQEFQNQGRMTAKNHDMLHAMGCMLYWGEGTKSKNTLAFTNSDVAMISFFLRFLRESLLVDDRDIRIHVNCYDNNGLSVDEIETFWLNTLGLKRSNLHQTTVSCRPISSKKRQHRKLLYGVCKVYVNSTKLVQHIMGAIQEYASVNKKEWLGK